MKNLLLDVFQRTGTLSLDHLRAGAGDSSVRQNALLQRDEWEMLDDGVLQIARTKLVGVADLIDRGLTADLGDLGTMVSTWEKVSDMTEAEVSMTGLDRGQRDRVTYAEDSVPVPIVHKPFQINIRHLLASRRRGVGIDTVQAETAAEQVVRKHESILFNGYSQKKLGNLPIYGYRTHPNRNADTATNFGGGDWGTAGNAYKTIKGMMKVCRDDGYTGPYGVYVATTQYDEALNLYGSLDNTELGIIMDKLPDLAFVKPSYDLPAGEVVCVSLEKRVVDLGVIEGIQNLMWAELGGFIMEFRVFSAMVPRIKADKEGKSGIAHATGA